MKLDLFAINDFHGQLEKVAPDDRPGRQSGGEVLDGVTEVNAGGAEYLSTHLKEWRAASRDSGAKPITVAAGDLIGASPLLSAAFHDEPTIEAMNAMGLRVSSVGTTSSTRATGSCSACSAAAASTTAPTGRTTRTPAPPRRCRSRARTSTTSPPT